MSDNYQRVDQEQGNANYPNINQGSNAGFVGNGQGYNAGIAGNQGYNAGVAGNQGYNTGTNQTYQGYPNVNQGGYQTNQVNQGYQGYPNMNQGGNQYQYGQAPYPQGGQPGYGGQPGVVYVRENKGWAARNPFVCCCCTLVVIILLIYLVLAITVANHNRHYDWD
mmetsp:Transcript_62360/g.71506  ORF Transcript_62360/g.71506 Transcript_62360/m.71506 type:complete len:165 (-) Transcript_62360:192-686(-)